MVILGSGWAITSWPPLWGWPPRESGDLSYGSISAGYILHDFGQVPDPSWALAFSAAKAMCIAVKDTNFGNGQLSLNFITNITLGKLLYFSVSQFLPLQRK